MLAESSGNRFWAVFRGPNKVWFGLLSVVTRYFAETDSGIPRYKGDEENRTISDEGPHSSGTVKFAALLSQGYRHCKHNNEKGFSNGDVLQMPSLSSTVESL